MCGRFVRYTPRQRIAERFGLRLDADADAPDYNTTPGREILLVTAGEAPGSASLQDSYWGFRPAWASADAPQPINARAERVAASPFFRSAFSQRRGIVPVDGWYEWRREQGRKQPYLIRHRDGELLLLAALWEPRAEGGSSCAIITQPATPALAHIHDRMPVALDPAAWPDWLDPRLTARERIRAATRPLPAEQLLAYPVSTAVNRPDHNGPELIEPLADSAPPEPR